MNPSDASSMKIEFTDKADLKQACYEATLDLVRYITHIRGIAERAQEHFPEVAAGLQGSADGIAKYLRGIDGEWQTRTTEQLHDVLDTEQFRVHMWAYEYCRDPRGALLLIGTLAGVASVEPDAPFWKVLAEARVRLSHLEPLIEQLLASSPRRTQ